MKSPEAKLVVAGVFHRWNEKSQKAEVLLFQRGASDVGGGHWEFPGGKVEFGESDSQALIRELDEEISIQVKVQEKLGSTQFLSPSGKKFELRVYFVRGPVEQIILTEHQGFKWVTTETLVLDEVSEGDRPLIGMCFEKLQKIYGKS